MHSRLDDLWKMFACSLATGLGVGLVPLMPGTVGSLWGLLLAWGFQQLAWPPVLHATVLVLLLLAGIPICARAAGAFNSKDPGKIVYDEYAALPIVFLFVPFARTSGLIGFLLFRLFDIIKPWPLRRLERLPDGLGIMADDIGAAIYAGLSLWVVVFLLGM